MKTFTISQSIRDDRATQFLAQVNSMSVIIHDGQPIADKRLFVLYALDAILDGRADHITDAQNRFDLLVRLYIENCTQAVII